MTEKIERELFFTITILLLSFFEKLKSSKTVSSNNILVIFKMQIIK